MHPMIKFTFFLFALLGSNALHAEISNDLVYNLKGTIVKVRSVNQLGEKSLGTGVVVAENQVATNCHVIAGAVGIDIHALGDGYTPVGLQADWKHDICILNFQFLPLKPAKLGDSEHVHYEDPVFSIGFPGGAPKPLTMFSSIKGLYALEDSQVIRISTSFQLGASGSPLFNEAGEVISLCTFKSPGKRNAFYYTVPVKWVKDAMKLPIGDFKQKPELAFWQEEDDKKPFWMQIVIPLQNEDWVSIAPIVKAWIAATPNDQEARFYQGTLLKHQGQLNEAKAIWKGIIQDNPLHLSSLKELADLASAENNKPDFEYYSNQLAKFEN
jgi:serine protease Do